MCMQDFPSLFLPPSFFSFDVFSPSPSPSPQRVTKLSQSIHYNDPLRKYLDIITKKFPADTQAKFSRGHDDYEDYTPSEDALSKGSLEKLYKKVTKAVRLANSTKM